ncbi:hypothetical protein Q5530_13095 [Saccharothrix sp. BKS2]|uniref:hypothetical protein n=1 Tax=Saccharothrix sp. BKS2 TaxID=3064400 RepID=UPI0039ECF951
MVVIALLVLIAIASVAIAALRTRGPRTRAAFLLLHVVVSVVLIAVLDGPRNLWIITLGPGLLVAAVRLATTLVHLGQDRGTSGGSR